MRSVVEIPGKKRWWSLDSEAEFLEKQDDEIRKFQNEKDV